MKKNTVASRIARAAAHVDDVAVDRFAQAAVERARLPLYSTPLEGTPLAQYIGDHAPSALRGHDATNKVGLEPVAAP